MGKTTIEWTDVSWNPVTGCSKVSQGCKHCYAERMAKRMWGERKFTDVMIHPERLGQPLHWRKHQRVFVNSMSDLFHEDVPFTFVTQVFDIMRVANHHTFQILTKRPARMLEYLEFDVQTRGARLWWPPHIWLGVSVENQQAADERIPLLLQSPATVRFVSCEPLLGPVDLTWINYENYVLINSLNGLHGVPIPHAEGDAKIDWVICGGESGPSARPMHPNWARSLRDQCVSAGVPFFFKQWGEWTTEYPQHTNLANRQQTYFDGLSFYRLGKKSAGRMLDGRTWDDFPG